MAIETRTGLSLPLQVKLFYRSCNGLTVTNPALVVLPLDSIEFAAEGRLHFATLDGSQPLYFNVARLNAAEPWDVVSADGFVITHSMASFWTNKIFAWVKYRRPIWLPWQDEEGEASTDV